MRDENGSISAKVPIQAPKMFLRYGGESVSTESSANVLPPMSPMNYLEQTIL